MPCSPRALSSSQPPIRNCLANPRSATVVPEDAGIRPPIVKIHQSDTFASEGGREEIRCWRDTGVFHAVCTQNDILSRVGRYGTPLTNAPGSRSEADTKPARDPSGDADVAELRARNATLEESLRETMLILDGMGPRTPSAEVETLQVHAKSLR